MPIPSQKQRTNRSLFKAAQESFTSLHLTEGFTPPQTGPRSRQWWYTESLTESLFYYDFYMKHTLSEYTADNTPEWIRFDISHDTYIDEENPNTNYSSSTELYISSKPLHNKLYLFKYDTGPVTNYNKTYLHVYLKSAARYGTYELINITFEVHKIIDPWDPGIVTWNTQPNFGAAIYTKTIKEYIPATIGTYFDVNKYIDIPIFNASSFPNGFMITNKYSLYSGSAKLQSIESTKKSYLII